MKSKPEKKPPKKITERYLYNAGSYYLKRYTASSGHFQTIMMRKIHNSCAHHTDQDMDECKALLDKTIEKLIEQGSLDDDGYTLGMVNSFRQRGLSQKAILAKLMRKRLPADLILKTIETIDSARNEYNPNNYSPEFTAALTHARKKRLGPFAKKPQDPADPKATNRALGSFARAGFSFEIAKTIMAMDEPPHI